VLIPANTSKIKGDTNEEGWGLISSQSLVVLKPSTHLPCRLSREKQTANSLLFLDLDIGAEYI